jgi:hypothetical protein
VPRLHRRWVQHEGASSTSRAPARRASGGPSATSARSGLGPHWGSNVIPHLEERLNVNGERRGVFGEGASEDYDVGGPGLKRILAHRPGHPREWPLAKRNQCSVRRCPQHSTESARPTANARNTAPPQHRTLPIELGGAGG